MATDPYKFAEEVNPLGSQRSLPLQSEQDDSQDRLDRAIDELMERRRQQEAQMLRDMPDDQSRRNSLSRSLGVPQSQITDIRAAERALAVQEHMKLRESNPAIARTMEANPNAAPASVGDEEPLGVIGTAWDIISKMPSRVVGAGGYQTSGMIADVWNSIEEFNDFLSTPLQTGISALQDATGVQVFDLEAINEGRERIRQQRREYFAGNAESIRERNRGENFLSEGILAGGESVPITLAAVATRSPVAGASTIGGLVGAQAFQDIREEGADVPTAIRYSLTQGVPEAAFEIAPTARLLELSGPGFLKGVGRYLQAEVPGELSTTLFQSFSDWVYRNPNQPYSQWVATLPEDAARTVLGVIGGGTVTVGTIKGAETLSNTVARVAEQRFQINQAQAEADFLKRVGDAAAKSKLRGEDEQAFIEMMRNMAEDAGVSTVFVPGSSMREYFQSEAYNRDTDPLAEYEQKAVEADLAGNDVLIPVELALTRLPGTAAWSALREDMRITAGGISYRQAQAIEENLTEELNSVQGNVSEADAGAVQATETRTARIERISDKLVNDAKFSPGEAEAYAETLVDRMTTRASRMGRDDAAIDQAVEELDVRQVAPPELARSVEADEQDMVVSILRGNEQGSTSRARAAAQELEALLARQGWQPADLSDEQLLETIAALRTKGEIDGREYRAGGTGSDQGGKYAPLDGSTKARGWNGPVPGLVDAAERYARENGIDLKRQAYFVTKEQFNEEFARRLAEAYEAMEHAPNDPAVLAAYEAMIAETRAQYDVLIDEGYSFTFFGNNDDPYDGNPFNAMRDIRDNKTMAVYSTIEGHGSGYSEVAVEDNPLLADTGLEWPDQNGDMVKVLANDLFRAVHDAFGHGLEGAGFRYDGEENAWQAHARLFSPEALPALTSETRGQNSWLNFGPRGEDNRFAQLEDTTFADQKAGLLPEWAWTENVVPDMEQVDGPTPSLEEALTEGETARSTAAGFDVGWTPERISDLLKAYGYSNDEERTKAYATRLTPDQFLGLTASRQGRDIIEQRVDQMDEYGEGIDFDQMRENPQAPFLVITIEGGKIGARTIPETIRVVGHEGRHRMTMLKQAGVTSVPVVVVLQDKKSKPTESMKASPQRSRSDQLASGDTATEFDLMEPISYANRERLGEVFGQGRELFQKDHKDTPRGRIVFQRDDTKGAIIELFEGRDLSTLIHESSHLWLEELKEDASDPNAPEQIKRDWQVVQDWFKANGYEVRGGVIPVGAHEMWARSGERYFREGKAPSPSLKRAFETFRSWLTTLYKRVVAGGKAPITPEIRGVFDRLLATDDQIAVARETQAMGALFDSAVAAGMTEDEFANYQEQVENAKAEAQGKVLEKTMEDIRARETRLGRERLRKIKDQIESSIDDQPVFKALSLMREDRLDRSLLEERFGAEIIGRLPVRVPPIYQTEGVDPEVVAEQAGFNSAQSMIEALVDAEAEQRGAKASGDKRSMKRRKIEQQAEAAFAAQYGGGMTEAQMLEEAQDAIANERQGEVIASELSAVSRQIGTRPTPYRVAREWARERVRQGVYVEEASKSALQRHRRAIAAAGKEAEQALIDQDMPAVYRAKQKQMLSSALLSEAKKAHEEVEIARRRMDRIAKARTMKSVDQDYLEQAHALLEAVDLKERSQAFLNKQGQFSEWAQSREAEGYDVIVPDNFAEIIGTTNWSRLPVEQVLGLDQAVKQVVDLGRFKQTLLDNKERREFEEVVAEAEAVADDIGRKPPEGSFTDRSWWENIKHRAAAFDAGLLKMEQVFDWLDNGNPNGVFNRIIFQPIAEAQARERTMLEDYHGKLKELFDAVDPKTKRSWGDKVEIDMIDPATGLPAVMERKRLIAMALNWGNEGNRQRLMDGYGWSEQGIQRALDENLTEDEWAYVRGIWSTFETLWPEIAKMERAINGVEPERVEPVDVSTPFGTFRGGYYPAVYDTRLDYKTEEREAVKADLFSANYIRANTTASATKQRSEKVKRPILLDLGVINRHIGEVVHDVTHREAVMQAHKFLNSERVMRVVDEVLGSEIREQMNPWLNYVANSWAQERAGNEGLGYWMGKLRANVTVVGMGWRVTTIMTQIAGYSNSFEHVGARWVVPQMALFQAQMAGSVGKMATFQGIEMPEMAAFALERSDELQFRLDTLDRDIRTEMDRMNARGPGRGTEALTAAKRFAFHGIGYMDRLVSVPTWMGAYNKALDQGLDEKDAAFAADKAIRMSQGAGAPKDLAAVSRGTGRWGEAFKLLTMFYSYLSSVYSRQRNLGRDIARGGLDDIPELIARTWWLVVVPPLLAELLSGRGPEEEESWGWWAFEKMLAQSLGAIPIARDLTSPVFDRVKGEPGFDYRLSPLQGVGQSVVNVAGDVGKVAQGEETTRATRNTLEAVGYWTGMVPGQFAASTQFLVDVSYGEQDPQDLSEWYEGLTKGKIKEE